MNTNKTVIIKLKGGMGNQMFQYAFGRALQETSTNTGTPVTVLFDTTAYTNPLKKDTRRPYMLEHLNTRAEIAPDKVALKARNPYGIINKIIRKVYQKFNLGNIVSFKPVLLQPPYKKYYEGYWQSERYFLPIVEQIRQEFTFKKPLADTARDMLKRISLDSHTASIFYRRTDYIGHSTFDIGEQEFQQKAIAHMNKLIPNLTLYVMSDDIEWVKKNANLPANSIFVSSDKIPPHEEMQLASACQNHIIPNSTFAWWGAWLGHNAQKVIIAPKNWSNGTGNKYKDITPENWIRI